jgi:RNA polymerase sigma-70 factor (ECF subfamily)
MAELSECIPSSDSVEADYENGRLADALNQFLASLPTEKRAIFLRRYFYSQPIGVIAETLEMREGTVKVTLHRLREQLRKTLQEQELL